MLAAAASVPTSCRPGLSAQTEACELPPDIPLGLCLLCAGPPTELAHSDVTYSVVLKSWIVLVDLVFFRNGRIVNFAPLMLFAVGSDFSDTNFALFG